MNRCRKQITHFFRFGVGKQSLESKITQEVSCFIDAIREEDGKAFDINVSLSVMILISRRLRDKISGISKIDTKCC